MLTKRKRKILFWITLAAFFVLGAAVLFYSLGYGIGPSWQLQKTGGIFIHATEAGAVVLVDEKQETSTSVFSKNVLIDHLLPGIHRVAVHKEGFWNWQRFVSVIPETVDARDVLLIPERPVINPIATSSPLERPVYYLEKHTVFQNESTKPQALFAGVKKFWALPRSGALLILGEDGSFYKNSKRIVVNSTPPEPLLDIPADIQTILVSLLGTKQNLVFDDNENRVIYWDEHTIGSYWIGKIDDMPQWQKTRSISVLTLPATIRNIMTYPRHPDYLLMEMGSGIWVLEMDATGGQNMVPLYRGNSPRLLSKTSDTLYIIDNNIKIAVTLP